MPARIAGGAFAIAALCVGAWAGPSAAAGEGDWIDLLGPDWRSNWTYDPFIRNSRRALQVFQLEPDGVLRTDKTWAPVHLYYVGPVSGGVFRNFELKAEVKLDTGANGGIYFHTAIPKRSWPKKGYEIKFNNTHRQRWKTGSLHGSGVPNSVIVRKSPVKDNEWFKFDLIVRGKRIIAKINGKTMTDWTEPPDKNRLRGGTIALQRHTKGIRFRNLRIKLLPDD